MLRLGVLRVFCCSVCLFVYWPVCHGALKLYMSTLLTTFFLWTSLQIIIYYLYVVTFQNNSMFTHKNIIMLAYFWCIVNGYTLKHVKKDRSFQIARNQSRSYYCTRLNHLLIPAVSFNLFYTICKYRLCTDLLQWWNPFTNSVQHKHLVLCSINT